jgi:AhpD family alkylhydroperoxidase
MSVITRMNVPELEPAAYAALTGVEKYVRSMPFPHKYKELIKIRASQINGCAYCIAMHTREARRLGETEQRIYALSAWHESPLFSNEERAILAFTEEVTLISKGGVKDETFETLRQHFDDNAIAQILMQIVQINTWNRIAVTSKSIFEEAAHKHAETAN